MASLFKSAWNRLVGTPDKAAPAPAPAFRASVPAPAPVGNASIDNLPPATLGARRPLISAHNGVVGYEFRIGGELRARFRRSPDAKAQSAYAATVLTSARLTSKSGRLGLARLPVDWLVHKYDAEVAKGVMVALDRPNSGQSLAHDLQTLLQNLQAMRTAGAQIGWPIDLNIKLKRDFVLLRQGQQDIGEVLEQIKHWPTDVLGLPVVLTDVQHLEDVELALLDGVRYVCGAVAPREAVAPKDAQALAPEAQRIAQVLQQLVTGAETPAIVEQVKADVGLSYKLLRRLKTAEMAHLKDCASIDQAVQLLGRNELYRWLTMLLLKSPGNRKGGQVLLGKSQDIPRRS